MSTTQGDEVVRTVHGSHLYGLAHASSDMDTYVVTTGRGRPRQSLATGDDGRVADVTTVGLSTFLAQCEAGVPQALEAMFSPVAEPSWFDAYRAGYRANVAASRATYRRTMRAFACTGSEDGDVKRRRHALRLWLNLADLLGSGRFDPRLTPGRLEWVVSVADDPAETLAWAESYPGAIRPSGPV